MSFRYWLYAAVRYKCVLVTNDEMRDHLFELLGNEFFPKWKERHQVWCCQFLGDIFIGQFFCSVSICILKLPWFVNCTNPCVSWYGSPSAVKHSGRYHYFKNVDIAYTWMGNGSIDLFSHCICGGFLPGPLHSEQKGSSLSHATTIFNCDSGGVSFFHQHSSLYVNVFYFANIVKLLSFFVWVVISLFF